MKKAFKIEGFNERIMNNFFSNNKELHNKY